MPLLSYNKVLLGFGSLLTIARDGGISVKVVYKEAVYRVTIQDTGERVEMHRWSKEAKQRAKHKAINMTIQNCPSCYSIIAGDVCMNRKCPTNKKDTPVA